jgi:hypothetical protein
MRMAASWRVVAGAADRAVSSAHERTDRARGLAHLARRPLRRHGADADRQAKNRALICTYLPRLETVVAVVRTIAAAGPVAGFGATAILIGRGGDPERTADAVAVLAEAALA